MDTNITLFTQVKSYYPDLVSQLETAEHTISMTYLSFDAGEWADRIALVLQRKASCGVKVRLMVDEIGELTDEPRHLLRNWALLADLRTAGVQVDLFRPRGCNLSQLNRMHCKFCAIDQRTVYLGGSNIGDYYLGWSDTNLRLDGELGNTFHGVYDYLIGFTGRRGIAGYRPIDPSGLKIGGGQIWLTIPGQKADIRRALLDLIHEADHSIHIRTWYFLPDREILQALCTKAEQGIKVDVLLSHRTRVPLVDAANYLHSQSLTACGGRVHRFTGQFMHAKLAWNNCGRVLVGSANLDPRSMTGNFEICLAVRHADLAQRLEQVFQADLKDCVTHSVDTYQDRSLLHKSITNSCNLVAGLL